MGFEGNQPYTLCRHMGKRERARVWFSCCRTIASNGCGQDRKYMKLSLWRALYDGLFEGDYRAGFSNDLAVSEPASDFWFIGIE
jgi:hypothetical protein